MPVAWDAVLAWEREDDSANYKFNPKSEMTLYCRDLPAAWDPAPLDAFDILLDAEDDCNTFQVIVEQDCGGVWAEVWTGTFQSKEWKSDRTRKTIRVKPREANPFDCLKDAWKEKSNPYGFADVEVKPSYLGYELTQQVEVVNEPDGDCPVPPTLADYCYYDLVRTAMPDLGITICAFLYHRYQEAGTCSGATPVEPDTYNTWTLLTDNCPTSSDWWFCPADGRIPYNFPNGRLFSVVLQHLVSDTGCGLTVVSDFFDINPDATAPSNDAYTAAAAYCHNLVVFQKSDVKRHDASDPSKQPAWEMTLEDFWADIKAMFNLDWKVDGSTLRIEHVSYFAASAGNDYTTEYYSRELEQDKTRVPAVTRFRYRDEYASDYFKGYPIEIYCGEGEQDIQLRLFSCDVAYITSADGLENIGDDGFVLFATQDIAGTLYNVDNNRGLSWTKLHENFHRHNMAGAGTINGVDTTPLSVKPTRKQPAFSVRHCCDDTFDPIDLITTALGQGEVQTAEWNIAKDILSIEAKY